MTEIDRKVIELFALVSDAVAGATHALLADDREAARAIVARDGDIDALFHRVEALVLDQFSAGPSTAQLLRYLIAVLRVLPELERSGDLAEHVAQRAARGIVSEMTARARGLVERMGEVASAMWRMSADAFGDRSPDAAETLDELDDEMDSLHRTFTAELVTGGIPLASVIELALIGRFYERLGDHAVNIARAIPGRVQRPSALGDQALV